MTEVRNYQIEICSKYCTALLNEGTKEFISSYEYYLTQYGLVDPLPQIVSKESERSFVFCVLQLLYIILEDEKSVIREDEVKQENMLSHFNVCIIFMWRKLLKTLKPVQQVRNPHTRMFSSDYAYNLFSQLTQTVINPHADYSFIYRKMLQDGFIFESVGDSEFRSWLSSTYEVEIDKTKQLYLCTTDIKELLYSSIKVNIQ